MSQPYSLRLTALSHGWVHLAPYYWDNETETLTRTEHVSSPRASVQIEIVQSAPAFLDVSLLSPLPLDGTAERELVPKLQRALATEEDLTQLRCTAEKCNKSLLPLLDAGGGRLLRGTTYFEDVVKTLFTTNASWQFTQAMAHNLIVNYGENGAFPAWQDLSGVKEDELRQRVRLGYRARYLVSIVALFGAASSSNKRLEPTSFFGLGEYGAAHAAVLRGDYSRIPIDSEVRSYCRKYCRCNSDADIRERYRRWKEYAFLGYKLSRQARKTNWIGEPTTGRSL